MPEEALIERILIRAKDIDGKWASLTLSELLDQGDHGIAIQWVLWKMCGLEGEKQITKEQLELLVQLIPKDGRYAALKDKTNTNA